MATHLILIASAYSDRGLWTNLSTFDGPAPYAFWAGVFVEVLVVCLLLAVLVRRRRRRAGTDRADWLALRVRRDGCPEELFDLAWLPDEGTGDTFTLYDDTGEVELVRVDRLPDGLRLDLRGLQRCLPS